MTIVYESKKAKMKLVYETTAKLGSDDLFLIIKQYIEKTTEKQLANIYWEDSDTGPICQLIFTNESVVLHDDK